MKWRDWLQFFLLLAVLICYTTANSQPLSTPDKPWLFLQPSAPIDYGKTNVLNMAPRGDILQGFDLRQGRISTVVISIFAEGNCLYKSEVEPFPSNRSQANTGEEDLRRLLQELQQKNISAYLSLDVLAWQSQELTEEGEKKGVFGKWPNWREVTGGSALRQKPEAFFASPFHPEVRRALVSLVQEVGRKFPMLSGIVLNTRLSEREILGFSEAARIASITDIGLDPIDLILQNRAEQENTTRVYEWLNWRRGQMASLVKSLSDAYKGVNPKGKVLAIGLADYYQRQEFNDLRRTQDWRYWLQQGIIDGVLLEGRWQSRYTDSRSFADFQEEITELADKNGKSLLLVPVSHGANRDGSSYGRDWANLKSRVPSLNEIALMVRNEEDLQHTTAFLSGKVVSSLFENPRLGEKLPELSLPNTEGKLWEARDSWGKDSMLLVIANDKAPLPGLFNETLKAWRQNGVQPVVVAPKPLSVAGAFDLKDVVHGLGSWFPTGAGYAVVDRAGFVRRLGSIDNVNHWNEKLPSPFNPTPLLEVGKAAPDFILRDMNGQAIGLSDFKGKRHLLLTFFPRCFTGGCKQHLASLQKNESALQAKGVSVVAVSVDPSDVQQAFAASLDAQFRFIPDAGRNLCILYGATKNTTDLAQRMSVLIDKSGIVRWIDTNVNVATHGADILAKMRELGMAQ